MPGSNRIHSKVIKGGAADVRAPGGPVRQADPDAVQDLFGTAAPPVGVAPSPLSVPVPARNGPADPVRAGAAAAPPRVAKSSKRWRTASGPPGLRLPRRAPPAPPKPSAEALLATEMRGFAVELAKVNLFVQHGPAAPQVRPLGRRTMGAWARGVAFSFLVLFLGSAVAVSVPAQPGLPASDLGMDSGSSSAPFQAMPAHGTGSAGPHDIVLVCHKPGTPAEKTLSLPLPAARGHAAHDDGAEACSDSEGNETGPGGGNGGGNGGGGSGGGGSGGNGTGPVWHLVCHEPGHHSLQVNDASLAAHVAHGDALGACPDDEDGGDGGSDDNETDDGSDGGDGGSDDNETDDGSDDNETSPGGGGGSGGGGGGGGGSGGGGGGGGGGASSASSPASAPASPGSAGSGGSGGGSSGPSDDAPRGPPSQPGAFAQGLPGFLTLAMNVDLSAAVGRRSHREGEHHGEEADQGGEADGDDAAGA